MRILKLNMEQDENKNDSEEEVDEFVPEDGEGNVETVEAKLKKLRGELKQCQLDKQEYLALSQRLKADYLNFEKATEARRADMLQFTNQSLLLDLLDLADSFELAFANKETWSAVAENWRQGVEYIYTKLVGILREYGLVAVNPLGELFDPVSHESIESVAVDAEEKDNRVIEVMKKGYRLRDRVLRPAQVKVGAFNK